jgi:hypothetical protein
MTDFVADERPGVNNDRHLERPHTNHKSHTAGCSLPASSAASIALSRLPRYEKILFANQERRVFSLVTGNQRSKGVHVGGRKSRLASSRSLALLLASSMHMINEEDQPLDNAWPCSCCTCPDAPVLQCYDVDSRRSYAANRCHWHCQHQHRRRRLLVRHHRRPTL